MRSRICPSFFTSHLTPVCFVFASFHPAGPAFTRCVFREDEEGRGLGASEKLETLQLWKLLPVLTAVAGDPARAARVPGV